MGMWMAAAAAAWGCGTFVGPDQVDQTGERILFREDGRNQWTAFVELQFANSQPGQTFAWLIPVLPSFDLDEDVSVAPPGLFDALEAVTAPRMLGAPGSLGLGGGEGCSVEDGVERMLPFGRELAPSFLVGEAVVGPYDIRMLDADSEALFGWLQDQGFSLSPTAMQPLQDYVDDGYHFLGVQLRAAVPEGPIATLVLACGMTEPSIPLKLTALAATEDMPITAYVLGNSRVSPGAPWTELRPDLAGVLDIAGYDEQLRLQQERAGGRAWTVEYASRVPALLQALDPEIAATLGHGAVITRLRAFVDPEEMGVDPVFVEDPDAPDVDNLLIPGVQTARMVPPASWWLVGLVIAGWRRRSQPAPR